MGSHSTNRAKCWLTMLIKANTLTTTLRHRPTTSPAVAEIAHHTALENFGVDGFRAQGRGLKVVQSCTSQGTSYSLLHTLAAGCIASHNAQCHRQMDTQTDCIIIPISDHIACSMISYWHHNAVCLSVRRSVTLCGLVIMLLSPSTKLLHIQPG